MIVGSADFQRLMYSTQQASGIQALVSNRCGFKFHGNLVVADQNTLSDMVSQLNPSLMSAPTGAGKAVSFGLYEAQGRGQGSNQDIGMVVMNALVKMQCCTGNGTPPFLAHG